MNTKRITTEIAQAADAIRAGQLVAVPTETVYGLAGNGLDPAAVAQIYEIKGRPAVKPLSLMVHDASAMARYCIDVPPAAYTLAEAFWPGPLTLVLEAKKDVVPSIVRAGKDTVGLRCPAHPLTLSLLERARLPLAGPSANPSGAPSPTTAQQVLAYFDGQIEGVIDGGECTLSRESTILDLTQKPFKILREGALAKEEIENALLSGVRLIGVTGGSGSGKTTVTQFLAAQGVLALDCDKIYHELLETNADMLAEIEARFPAVFKNGKLDRKMLGAIVFAVPEALRDLNAITHRYVREDIYRRLREYVWQGGTVAVVDAIALFESGISEDCVFTVGVTAPDDERCARIMVRDGIDADYALARIEAQPDDEYYEMRCDYLLRNDGTPEELKAKCRELFGIG